MLISGLFAVAALYAVSVEATQRRLPLVPRQYGLHSYINGTNTSNAAVELQISTKGGGRNKTSPLLYGWMIEDISVRRAFWLSTHG